LPQIEAAVQQGITIPLNTTPAGAVQPQLSIRTTMAEQQQEEINAATGQTQQAEQNINVIAHGNGALKGNPPFIFDGDRSKTRRFTTAFDLWKAINRNNETFRKPFSRVVTMLSYMDGEQVDAWKEERLKKLIEEVDDGALETDETLWDELIDAFKNAFVNQNRGEEAYQELHKVKQGDSLDEFFAKFKRLVNEADVQLDDKGTIELLKHGLKPELTRAVINLPTFDPAAEFPWSFKKWEDNARQCHNRWQAGQQYRRQGLYKTFG